MGKQSSREKTERKWNCYRGQSPLNNNLKEKGKKMNNHLMLQDRTDSYSRAYWIKQHQPTFLIFVCRLNYKITTPVTCLNWPCSPESQGPSMEAVRSQLWKNINTLLLSSVRITRATTKKCINKINPQNGDTEDFGLLACYWKRTAGQRKVWRRRED